MESIKINAENQKLGRLASRVALLLQDKNKPNYDPKSAGVNKVIVENAAQISVSGKKYTDKIYYHHTGYMGHLRENTFRTLFEKSPEKVLRLAIFNMLPKNRLRAKRLNRLTIKR